MVQTVTRLDGSDIDFSSPVHGYLAAAFLIVLLTGMKPEPSDPADDKTFSLKRLVAEALNHAADSGISIVSTKDAASA